jgi:hypothetical protein
MNIPGITDIATSIEEQNRAKTEEQSARLNQVGDASEEGAARSMVEFNLRRLNSAPGSSKQDELMERLGDQITIMNSRMEESLRSLRNIENHTDRTARGVA